jgi:transcriptional regulator with PAS, ATPase and Fis domain
VIAATNRDLYDYVEKEKFREDLFYRLCVLRLDLPPLRDRKEDLNELVDYFIHEKCRVLHTKTKSISQQTMSAILQYDWPGNVRQLENFIERCVVLSGERDIDISYIDDEIVPRKHAVKEDKTDNKTPKTIKRGLGPIDDETILNMLEETKGNRKLAAENLGISVTTLWRRLKKMQ